MFIRFESKMRRIHFLFPAIFLFWNIESTAFASTVSWGGTVSDNWNANGNWVGGAAPASNLTQDLALFNLTDYAAPGITAPKANANRQINGILIGDGVTLTGSFVLDTAVGANRFEIGSSGIVMSANTGSVTIGSAANGGAFLGSNQTWSNNSSGVLSIRALGNNGNITPFTLTLSGSGSGGITFVNDIVDGGTTGTVSLNVNMSGTGPVTLTGANTATGLLTITAGTGIVGTAAGGNWTGNTVVNGGTLKGRGAITGSVTLNSGGTYSPGNSPGIQSIGSLVVNSGSTVEIEIDGATAGNGVGFYDQIRVTGAATLNGGTLKAETIFSGSSGFVPTIGSKLSVITAGSLNGQFALIDNSNNPVNIGFVPEYTSNGVNLYVTPGRTWATIPGLTANEQSVGVAMEGFRAQGISNVGGVQTEGNRINQGVIGKSTPEVMNAIEQMNPEKLTAMGAQSFSSSKSLGAMMGVRIQELRAGVTGTSLNGVALYDQAGETVYEPLADSGDKLVVARRRDPTRWSFFVNSSGLFEDIESKSGHAGYQSKSGDSLLGVDYRFDDHFIIGLAVGQSYGVTDFAGNSGKTETNGGRIGAFSNYRNGAFYVSEYLGGGLRTYDTERKIFFLNEKAKGSTQGREINTFVNTGYDFQYEKLVFGPAASLGYDRVWIDEFEEEGSAARLKIDDQGVESLRTNLGVKVSYPIRVWGRKIIPQLQVGWEHEFKEPEEVRAQFTAGGDYFSTKSSAIGKETFVLEQRWTVYWTDRNCFTLGYQGRFLNADYQAHGVSAGLGFYF